MKTPERFFKDVKELVGTALLPTCVLGAGLIFLAWGGKPRDTTQLTTFSFETETGIAGPAKLAIGTGELLFGTSCMHPETIFSFNPQLNRTAILHTFSPLEGGLVGLNPNLLVAGPVLFGTTAGGGASGRGTIYRIQQDGTAYAVIHEFGVTPESGIAPLGQLLLGRDQGLYGTTFYGGRSSGGILFRIEQDGLDFQILHHFGANEDDGTNPRSGVVSGPQGSLYGTTVNGGSFRAGSLFLYDPSVQDYSLLWEFGYPEFEGSRPYGALIPIPGGKLVGTTSSGGKYDCGTIFLFDPEALLVTTIHHFRGHDGAFPQSELTYASDGFLYGTAPGGGELAGTLFRLKPDGSKFRLLHSFGSSEGEGANPISGVVCHNGRLYGATPDGGSGGFGAVFTAPLLPRSVFH